MKPTTAGNRFLAALLGIWILLVAGYALSPSRTADNYDIVFAHARVIDGTGAPWFRADVGVRGDRIAAVGDLSNAQAVRRIDVRDRVIAPGFIDLLGPSEMNLLIDNRGADLVVFDPATVRDLATYTDPLRYAEGFEYVTINGRLVLDAGKMTPERPGRVLRHKR